MKYIKYNQLIKIKQHLKLGGVVAYATESCFGFGCDPFNYKAIVKILKIKQRSKTKGMIMIAGNRKQVRDIIDVDIYSSQFDKYWPGQNSIVLPYKKKLPSNLTGAHKSIAVRITSHKQVIQLTRFLQKPLVSTSANVSGMKSIRSYRECVKQFGKMVLVIDGLTNFAKKPSTIIDLKTNKIIR